MATLPAPTVAVVIGVYNAGETIGRAILSALAQAEVREVIVVDDASTDDSVAMARSADDGSGRLVILQQPANAGPAAARNRAIASSHAPYIAVLDADDFLLPDRFSVLFADRDWDLIADNIVFVSEDCIDQFCHSAIRNDGRLTQLDLSTFVRRNMSSRSTPRGELGFLKVVMRREFFDKAAIRYDESLRLGEDYVLYCQALAAGARFRLSRHCGYVAIERGNSLSGRHRTEDLFALASADARLIEAGSLSSGEDLLLQRHRDQILAKANHRHFLDERHRIGLARAVLSLAMHPKALLGVMRDVLLDKLALVRPATPEARPPLRYLFD